MTATPWVGRLTLALCLLLTSALVSASTLITSPSDDRSYRPLTLDNGLKVLLIHSPQADKAAASLEVSVGSGADPQEFAGLAHFLEHMLFLGTAKYPEAGAYQAYIGDHGGRHNAFTAYDRTNYFFDIDPQYLEPALDRFAQFFISPLFNPGYVDRERHAVHSEYQSRLKEDGRRGYAAFKQALNPAHPMAQFSVGSLETLRDQPDASLQAALKSFYRAHYTANRMSLVIQGPQPLDTLQRWTQSKFGPIVSGHGQAPVAGVPLFKPGQLPARLDVVSLRDLHELSLTFPVPPVDEHWDTKPLHFLGALIGHEGPTSLLAELKRRGWAQGLSAGPGFDYPDSATFSVHIDLTAAGFEHYDQVVELLFATVARIRAEGIEAWRYHQERLISETQFRFKEPTRELYDVLRLAGKLRKYPTAELLHGDYLYRQFDPALIRRYLDQLRPDNLLLTRTAQQLTAERIEPNYQTPYTLTPISAEQIQRWRQAPLMASIRLPQPNAFLAEDFSLEPEGGADRPERIRQRPGFTLWYQQDDDFRLPRGNFYFTFRSPLANGSALQHMQTSLFIELVNDQLNSQLYPANVAGFSTSLYRHIRGFSLRQSGYSDKQVALLETQVNALPNLTIDPERLAVIKQRLRQQLENRRQATPYELAFDRLNLELLRPSWSIEQRLQALDQIDVDNLQAFIPRLLATGEIEALAHGNFSRDDALQLGAVLEQRLLSQLTPVAVAPGQAQSLPAGTRVVTVAVDHNDKALLTYLQGLDDSLAERARFGLLNKLISAPFYTELRTEKQRGYVVFSSAHPILEHPGLALVIQSPTTGLATLRNDIDDFLQRAATLVNQLDQKRLAQLKQSLLVTLLAKDNKLSDRTNRYWQELDRDVLTFDSRQQLAAAIRAVTLKDLQATYQRLTQRQLVLQAEREPSSAATAAR